jgi:glycosyltransferase involved in cell wall biosynthesis
MVSEFNPCIIISHSDRCDLLIALIKFFHPTHPNIIRTAHIDIFWATHPLAGFFINNLIFPLIFNAEVAVSDSIKKVLDRRILSKITNRKSYLIYNGIDENHFNSSTRKFDKITIPARNANLYPLLGIIGRLSHQKGHKYLVQAIKLISTKYKMHLVIVGSGSLENILRKQVAELELDDCIHFLGSREDIYDVIHSLDVLVSASLWEGFPTVILEAMAIGIPVIATDVSGSRELINNYRTGIIVKPKDPIQLANAIEFMITNPIQMNTFVRNAKKNVKQYTIQNAAKKFNVLCNSLIK